jgi:Heparinase II/III-like protein/Heparinase II/III N-terminus
MNPARIFATLSYLKKEQLFYQVYYRLRASRVSLASYAQYLNNPLHPVKVNVDGLIPATGRCSSTTSFSFLNKAHEFEAGVDWNYNGKGRLWNYNLQYFDFLHDSELPREAKLELVESCAAALLSGSLKPEPYPVSLRIINWIIFASREGYTSAEYEKALRLQIGYLRKNLEYHIQANHLLENYLSLWVASVALQDEKLFLFSSEQLAIQLKEQVLEDGAHYECSPMYHSVLLGKILLLIDIARQNPFAATGARMLVSAAEKMLGWLFSFCWKNGSWEPVNDAAPGIAPTVQTLFQKAQALHIESRKDLRLSASGYRRLNAGPFELLFDAGPVIPSYQPGHAHCDMLQVCLKVDGQSIWCDTGTSTYDAGPQRLQERGTAAHNTVTITGREQSAIWSSFRIGRRADCRIKTDEENLVEAMHNGFSASDSVFHRRRVELNEVGLQLTDTLEKGGVLNEKVIGQAVFHFPPGLPVVQVAEQEWKVGDRVHIHFAGAHKVESVSWPMAVGFNLREEALCLKAFFTGKIETKVFCS